MALRDGVSSFLADVARRLAPRAAAVAPAARLDAGQSSATIKTDCGPGGGCGAPGDGWLGYDAYGLPSYDGALIGLSREQVDAVCVETLMNTVVVKIVEDALREAPTLSGDRLGELSDVVPWLSERGWNEADEQALCYERYYGGGGVVCITDDGQPADQEVDLSAVRSVEGFFALSKWNLVPADVGSSRVRAGWYGQRFGRPEHYFVTPDQPALRGMPVPDQSAANVDAVLSRGGNKWHRSRVVPRPHRDKMDMRMARRFGQWRGWGPGVVEGCLASYLARREGALHTNEVLRASHFNVFQTPNVAHSQAGPGGTQAIDNMLAWLRGCLARTRLGGGSPTVAIDKNSTLEAISHTLTGISEILREQRQYFLDNVPEYPEVVLMPGSGSSGLSGDGKEGEWQAYDQNVMAFRQSKVWTAGAFGGGMRQAAILAMASRTGPTRGQVDLTILPTWAPTRRGTAASLAAARKANAEARALDKVTLGMTPTAFLRHEPGLAGEAGSQYPSLDVDDAPLPEAPPGVGALNPAVLAMSTSAAPPPKDATSPAAAVTALQKQKLAEPASSTPTTDEAPPASGTAAQAPVPDFAPEPVDPSVLQQAVAESFPPDIATERELAKALLMTPKAFQTWVAGHHGVKRYPVPKGMRGGARYSLGEVLEAFKSSATAKLDRLRASPDFSR